MRLSVSAFHLVGCAVTLFLFCAPVAVAKYFIGGSGTFIEGMSACSSKNGRLAEIITVEDFKEAQTLCSEALIQSGWPLGACSLGYHDALGTKGVYYSFSGVGTSELGAYGFNSVGNTALGRRTPWYNQSPTGSLIQNCVELNSYLYPELVYNDKRCGLGDSESSRQFAVCEPACGGKCDANAVCSGGTCVCKSGWVGDGETCSRGRYFVLGGVVSFIDAMRACSGEGAQLAQILTEAEFDEASGVCKSAVEQKGGTVQGCHVGYNDRFTYTQYIYLVQATTGELGSYGFNSDNTATTGEGPWAAGKPAAQNLCVGMLKNVDYKYDASSCFVGGGKIPLCELLKSQKCSQDNGGCDDNAVCTDTTGGPTCECASGYTGDGQTCSDVDECLLENGGCDANADCTNIEGDRVCTCKPGWLGDGETCLMVPVPSLETETVPAEASGEQFAIDCAEDYINIEAASYGANCKESLSNNQLTNLQAACDGKNSCTYEIDHHVIGDPFLGCAKAYTYSWQCDPYPPCRSASAATATTSPLVLLVLAAESILLALLLFGFVRGRLNRKRKRKGQGTKIEYRGVVTDSTADESCAVRMPFKN